MTWPIIYRDFTIEPHSHYPGHRFMWAHVDYDGPEDRRIGTGDTVEACKADIDEWYDERGMCAYGKHADQVVCDRIAVDGWTTCKRHHSGGRAVPR